MGTFVKDNISGINVGSKSSNVSGKTVQSSNIDISNIERGSSEFTSNSNISSSVDFGDLFNDKAQASEVSSVSMTNGSTNIDGTNQSSSSVSQHGMANDKVNENSTNQQTGNAQSASLSNGKNEENNTSQATGRASSQGATSGGNQGSSTGQQGGSAHGASTSSGKGPSGSKGATGAKASGNSMSGGTPASGRGGSDGHKAGGVEVKSTTVKNATRPTAFNNNSSMQQTGTTVSQRTAKSSKVETNVSRAQNNTGSKIGKAVKWFIKEAINAFEKVKATEVVITTSVLSAVGNIVEAVVIDGLVGYVVAGALDFFGADDIANDLRKFAARDQVGEINKWFYEETDIGRQINELSAIKYDSAVAKGITSLSEMAIKIAAATAISMVPGGIFIVAGIGALEGMGNAAESAYQNALANGEDDLTLSVWSNLGILGSGALDAVAWVFNAKLGQGLLSIAGDIGKIGIKETTVNFGKQLFSKDTIKNILDSKNLLMNMGQSGLQSGGQIGKIFSKFMNGEEIKAEDWWDLAQTYGTYLFLNIAEDVLTESVSDYGKADSLNKLDAESPEKIKEPETNTNDIKEKVLVEDDSIEPTIEMRKQEDIELESKHKFEETNQIDIEEAKRIEAAAIEPYEFKCKHCGFDDTVSPNELDIHKCSSCGHTSDVDKIVYEFEPEKQKKFREVSEKYEDLLDQQGKKPLKRYKYKCQTCGVDDFITPHDLDYKKCSSCGETTEVEKIIENISESRRQNFIDEMQEYEDELREAGTRPIPPFKYICPDCGGLDYVSPTATGPQKCGYCGESTPLDMIESYWSSKKRKKFEQFKELDIKQKEMLKAKKEALKEVFNTPETLESDTNFIKNSLHFNDGTYGVDQGAFRNLIKNKRLNNDWLKDREELRKLLIEKFPEDTPADTEDYLNHIINSEKVNNFTKNIIIEYITKNTESYDDAFDIYSKSFTPVKADYYDKIVGKYMKMGLSEKEAVDYLLRIDNTGACSYAAQANGIAAHFADKEELFKEKFGFDLYREVDGKKVINSQELLADLYTYANTKSNVADAKLFDMVDGKLKILSDNPNNQVYLTKRIELRGDILQGYLKSKSIDFEYQGGQYSFDGGYWDDFIEMNVIAPGMEDSNKLTEIEIHDKIKNLLDENYNVQLGIYRSDNKMFTFKNSDDTINITTDNWSEGDGHAVFITDIYDSEIIISSWGERLKIPISEFVGNCFNIVWSKIT